MRRQAGVPGCKKASGMAIKKASKKNICEI